MKITIFALADYVTDQAGKLTIIGAFDRMMSSKFPFVAPPFGVAVKGYVERNDYGKQRKIAITIRPHNKKDKIFEAIAKVEFVKEKSRAFEAMLLKFMLANVEFKSPGVYVVECRTGRRILSSIQLEAVRVSAPAVSKKVGKKVAKKKTVKKKVAKTATKRKVTKKR